MNTTRRSAGDRGAGWRGSAPLVLVLAWMATAEQAATQFIMGPRGGFGYIIQPYQPPASVTYLQERSLINARNAATNRDFGYGTSNPNAYYNRRREVALAERFDVRSRQGLEGRISARYRPVPAPRPQPRPAPARPAPPPVPAPTPDLVSFFNQYHELVWPADAPYEGQFQPLRDTADAQALATLKERNQLGLATVATATGAREALLDYGRPALQYVRDRATPQVADAFHGFLLALYGSLERAATVPQEADSN